MNRWPRDLALAAIAGAVLGRVVLRGLARLVTGWADYAVRG